MPLGHMALNTTAYGLTASVGAGNASGIALPNANITGWNILMAEDFGTNFAAGGVSSSGVFPSPYANEFLAYADQGLDTSGNNNGSNSVYNPSTNLSVSASKAITLFNVVAGVPHPTTGVVGNQARGAAYVVTPFGSWGGQNGGRFEVCYRVPSVVHGFKMAFLLWPDSGVWPRDSEVDWPEGSLNTGGAFTANFLHQGSTTFGANDFDNYRIGNSAGPDGLWHVATIEWLSGTFVRALWDGVTVGTTYDRVPNTAMHWVIQAESDVDLYGTGGYATTGDTGTLEVDWLSVWTANSPSVPGAGTAPSSTAQITEAFTGTNGNAISVTNWTSTKTTTGATAQIQTNKGRFTTGVVGAYGDELIRLSTTNQPSATIIKATLTLRSTAEQYPYLIFNDNGTGTNGYRLYFYVSASEILLDDGHGQNSVFTYHWPSTWTSTSSFNIEIIIQSDIATFRIWDAAGGRPTNPSAQSNVSLYTGNKCGLGIIGGNAATSVAVDWDDFSIASIP